MRERAGLGRHALAGALGAIAAGALMAALAGSFGGLAGSAPAILALLGPLLIAGVVYGWLLDNDLMRAGFGPGILFWIAALPASRVAQELMVGSTDKGLSQGVMSFVVYQALVGGAFGLGFVILHTQISSLLPSADPEGDAASR
jgi:hypothetical protein